MKYYPDSLLKIPLLLFLTIATSIFTPSSATKITYHNGPILSGEIKLSILWYGKLNEQQKSHLRVFISSLNNDKNVSFEPRVTDWWRMVESYQLLADKKLKVAPKITVSLTNEIDDPTRTHFRDEDLKDAVKKVTGDGSKSVAVIVLGEKVEWESAGSCFMHKFDGQNVAIVVANQVEKVKNNCGWPFVAPPQGNVGFLVPAAPTEVYTDLMVIHFASALAGTVTNPQNTGFFSDEKEDKAGGGDQQKDSVLDVASLCEGIFGSGAFPGYAGRVRIDPHSGAGFNAHGLNSTMFMLPALWDPNEGVCWTTM